MTAVTGRNSHRTGQGYLTTWTPDKVVDSDDPALAFNEYAQQILGTPYSTIKDIVTLRRKAKDFFGHYPHCDWYTLCRVVLWVKKNQRYHRVDRVWKIVDKHRAAWMAGALPELARPAKGSAEIEERIARALVAEQDPDWRHRLLGATSDDARRYVIDQWESSHAST